MAGRWFRRCFKRPKRWSLRSRLLAGVLVMVAAGFTAADLASIGLLRSYLVDRIDEQLYLLQDAVVAMDPTLLADDQRRAGDDPRRASSDGYVVEYHKPDGSMQLRYAGPANRGAPSLPNLDLPTVRGLGTKPFFVKAVEHRHPGYRAILVERPNGNGSVLVAYDLSNVAETMGHLGIIEIVVTLLVLALATLLGIAVIRVGLRPLTEVEQTAEDIIAGGDLSRRVPVQAAPATEIGRLSRTLNTMLTEIEGSFRERSESEARLRRFVADASHELRTPLAGIRGLAELHRQGAVSDPAEVAALLARVETEATRMGLLVEDLLLLARLDEQRPLRSDPVDLVPIAVDAVEAARLREPDRLVRLHLLEGPDPVVLGDEDRLQQVATNLIGNALTHTPPGTPVTVRVGVISASVLFEVVDSGPGIGTEHAKRVFERFYRVDPARSRNHERSPAVGSGLGLSIVAALVAAHGGTVRHVPTPGGGATFTATFPLPA
jgi:two-component system OmpR family sensor kinase